MIGYEQFKSKLKELVHKTAPDRAGRWSPYLEKPDSELQEFVVSFCYSWLGNDNEGRRDIEDLIDDDDVLWFIAEFISRQAADIQKPSDTEPLLLGLSAVAIIGPHSDPRDVTVWLAELYHAAWRAGVRERKQLFERVGNFAPTKCGVTEQIKSFPDRNAHELEREPPPFANDPQTTGLTPMMQAALKGDLPSLFDLIKQGEDVNATMRGASALACAAFAGHESAVELLLESGARVDVRPHGMSLLDFANLGGQKPKIIELLKAAGA